MKSYGGPIGTQQRSFERNHPDPLRPPLPQEFSNTLGKYLITLIISGTGKATNFKFGRYIHVVHPNKNA